MKEKKQAIKQPSKNDERELLDINRDAPTEVFVRGTKSAFKIRYMKPYTTEKITELLVSSKVDVTDDMTEFEALEAMKEKSVMVHKCAAYIILNRAWKIALFHGILWRYFYFVKEYNYEDLLDIVETGKKKIQLIQFLMAMVSLETMRETKMMMTKKEARPFLQELLRESEQALEKKIPGL